jgi:hypothetical protein
MHLSSQLLSMADDKTGALVADDKAENLKDGKITTIQ